MVYEWKSNSRIKAKPEKAAAVFEELERKGELTPERVVEVSRPKNAPLHGEFQWVDKIAAEEYRKIQARHLIMCLVVRDETDEVESRPVRPSSPWRRAADTPTSPGSSLTRICTRSCWTRRRRNWRRSRESTRTWSNAGRWSKRSRPLSGRSGAGTQRPRWR